MARILPDGWEALEAIGAAEREIETLRVLARLPDDYTVVHGVHWTRVEHGASVYGDIDFVVVAANGRVLLIEQRSGFLEETADGLVKAQGASKKRIAPQIVRSIETLATRFREARHGRGSTLALDYLFYCPDYRVRDGTRAGIAVERIVDSSRATQLVAIVADLMQPAPPAESADASAALRFFSDELLLASDVATLIGRTERWVTRLSGGLAAWAMQLDFAPFRLRVRGTAGSGKTQLALRVLDGAVGAGKSALYLCYNRPLADHIARIAPEGAVVATFHGFGDRLLRAAGAAPDFSAADPYARLETAVLEADPDSRFDVLIVDEGQDFTAAWRDAVLRFVAPEGKAYWLEDPMQNLYEREPVALPGWVTLHANVNFRSPRDVLETLVPMLVRGLPPDDAAELRSIQAASPLAGSEVEITTWDASDGEASSRALVDATMRAVTRALAAGYRRNDIAVLTFAGRDHSAILALDALGPHRLRRFAGSYDLFGNPEWSDGEVTAETIYRFKGQSAPCVIFTEVDFETLDRRVARKLFVGATRASTKLMIVMSERAARVCAGEDARAE